MASLFDTLQAGAQRAGIEARTKESRNWFRKKVDELGSKVTPRKVLKDDALDPVSKEIAGNMYMYFYNPKYKDELPYYDRFPLVIMVEPAPGGFYGLNLHYLSPIVRARFLDALMDTAPKNINDKSRLRLRYDLLKSVKKFKEFQPCFKHYLTSNVQGRMVRVPMTEWEIAIFLPTEQFKKVKKETVWRYSRKQYAR